MFEPELAPEEPSPPPHHYLAWVRITPCAGGLYLAPIDEGAAPALFVPDEEIGALIVTLQQHLERRQAANPALEMLQELWVWRVTGTILYDDPDGEEHTLDLDMTIEAADEQEAMQATLEQLQSHYRGASWDGAPECERLVG